MKSKTDRVAISRFPAPRLVVIALAMVLALASCSQGAGSSDDADTTGDADAGETDNGSTGSEATLQVGVPSDVDLTRVQAFLAQNQMIRQTVFDYLLDRAADGTLEPSLATDWAWNEDETTLVLTTREGVEFHTGREFGPDDVVASIEAALEEDSGVQVAAQLRRATSVEATGPSEVTFELDEPFPPFLDALAMLPMIDSETYDQVEEGEQLIGTGPFMWRSWTPDVGYEMERNENYWGETPPLEEVIVSVIPEPQAMLAAMRAGEIHLANRMVPRDAATLAEQDGFSVDRTEGFDVYVGSNTDVEPLDDIRVRQAIAFALDRERIAEQVYQGFAEPSAVLWSSQVPGVTSDMVDRYAYDLDQARALLEEADAVGAEVTLTSFAADPAYAAAEEIVRFGLEEIGLQVNSVTMDQSEFIDHLQNWDMPGLWVTPIALTAMGPATALTTALPLLPDGNTHNFTEPEYGELVDDVLSASSEDEQSAAIAALTEYMQEQAFHNTFVQAQTPVAHVDGLTGLETDLTLAIDVSQARLSE